MTLPPPVPVGAWLTAFDAALTGTVDADVPCGTCTACCSAHQFVHIEPDEHEALAAVPAALHFPAPGLPAGHVLLPYDEAGRCPMLGPAGCTIYPVRPRTCRTYDCRVFAVTDLTDALAADPHTAAIAARAETWSFSHEDDAARAAHEAVRRAARHLRTHPEVFTEAGRTPPGTTGLAVLAIRARAAHLDDAPLNPEDR